jgi:hypothetical protein
VKRNRDAVGRNCAGCGEGWMVRPRVRR